MVCTALFRKEIEEHRAFGGILLGGTALVEGYAVYGVQTSLPMSLLTLLPVFAITFVLPARLLQTFVMERRSNTDHLLFSLPVRISVPIAVRAGVILLAGLLALSVALTGIYIASEHVRTTLQLPGVANVRGADVVAVAGLGSLSMQVLLLGIVMAVEGLLAAVRRMRILVVMGFLFGGFLLYVTLMFEGVQLFRALLPMDGPVGQSYFAYNLCCGLGCFGLGAALFESYAEA